MYLLNNLGRVQRRPPVNPRLEVEGLRPHVGLRRSHQRKIIFIKLRLIECSIILSASR